MGGLVVYVTSHGFGHLNRSVAVINKMPLCVPVTIRCDPKDAPALARTPDASRDARTPHLRRRRCEPSRR